MKKGFGSFCLVCSVFLVAGSVSAAGNSAKGKYIYRNVYKACAERGEIASSSPTVSPSDKTMKQWERTFEKKKFDIFGCSKEWNELTEANLEDIYTYLYDHAADSPTPAKCK